MLVKRVPHPSGKWIHFDSTKHTYSMQHTITYQTPPSSSSYSKKKKSKAVATAQQQQVTTMTTNVALRSTSSILDTFFPFDKDGISKAVAMKQNVPQDVVLAAWNSQRDIGSAVHTLFEKSILEKRFVAGGGGELLGPAHEAAVERVLPWLLKEYDFLAVEQIVAAPELFVAGTIDAVARNK
eukprot:PhF_6_TR31391/c0_g1_i2/m.45979